MFNRILEIIDQFNIKEHRHFKNKINNYILIGLVCSLLIMFVYLMIRFHDNHNINYIDNMKKKLDTKYENVHPYKGIKALIRVIGIDPLKAPLIIIEFPEGGIFIVDL